MSKMATPHRKKSKAISTSNLENKMNELMLRVSTISKEINDIDSQTKGELSQLESIRLEKKLSSKKKELTNIQNELQNLSKKSRSNSKIPLETIRTELQSLRKNLVSGEKTLNSTHNSLTISPSINNSKPNSLYNNLTLTDISHINQLEDFDKIFIAQFSKMLINEPKILNILPPGEKNISLQNQVIVL